MSTLQKRKRKPGAGRPPSGPGGVRTSQYPKLTVRLPEATKSRLEALSALRRVPVWRLIDEAVTSVFEGLPADERRLIAAFVERQAKSDKGTGI